MACNYTIILINPTVGVIYICHGSLYIIPYILCLYVMSRPHLRVLSCYKIMISMGIVDLINLFFNSLLAGIISILGSPFCLDHMYWNRMISSGAWASWCTYCALSITLALDRFCEGEIIAFELFQGEKTWFWIAGSGLYRILQATFYSTPLASYAYKADVGQFVPGKTQAAFWVFFVNNFITMVSITVLYTMTIIKYKKRMAILSVRCTRNDRMLRRLLCTSLVICSLTVIGAAAYLTAPLLAPYWHYQPPIMTLGHIGWQIINGGNCIVYLTINKTIRNGVFGIIGLKVSESSSMITNSQQNSNVINRSKIEEDKSYMSLLALDQCTGDMTKSTTETTIL